MPFNVPIPRVMVSLSMLGAVKGEPCILIHSRIFGSPGSKGTLWGWIAARIRHEAAFFLYPDNSKPFRPPRAVPNHLRRLFLTLPALGIYLGVAQPATDAPGAAPQSGRGPIRDRYPGLAGRWQAAMSRDLGWSGHLSSPWRPARSWINWSEARSMWACFCHIRVLTTRQAGPHLRTPQHCPEPRSCWGPAPDPARAFAAKPMRAVR